MLVLLFGLLLLLIPLSRNRRRHHRHRCRPHVPALKKYTYGKHIINRLEKMGSPPPKSRNEQ